MNTQTVKPQPNCTACRGSGEVLESEYGEVVTTLCDCVIDQLLPGTTEVTLDLSDFEPDHGLPVSIEP